jgi:hypothetical protein
MTNSRHHFYVDISNLILSFPYFLSTKLCGLMLQTKLNHTTIMASQCLIQIRSKNSDLLIDDRVVSSSEANMLQTLFNDRPDFTASFSGPVDWEEDLKDLNLTIITDSNQVTSFMAVYPNGIHTLPLYDDIWESIKDEQEELENTPSDSDEE